jgi:hypothetical protein
LLSSLTTSVGTTVRTGQKPRRRAKERDKDGVARWLREDFPHTVRASGDRYAYLVLLDESASC